MFNTKIPAFSYTVCLFVPLTTSNHRSINRSNLSMEVYYILWVVRVESVCKTYILRSTNGHTVIQAVC